MRLRLGVLCATLPARAIAATVTAFNLPHGDKTCGVGIALNGTVVGADLSKTDPPVNFIYRNGHFGFPHPLVPAGFVTLTGVNRHNEIAGADLVINAQAATTYAFHASAGAATVLSVPGEADMAATGINEAGTLVGWMQATGANAPMLGFTYTGGNLTALDAGIGTGTSTTATAINDAGTIVVGTLLTGTVFSSWIYQNGQFTPLMYPHATATIARGVYGTGWVTGTYYAGTAPTLIAHGFLYYKAHYFPFNVKGAAQTIVNGANQLGQFTGCYIDGTGTHGIIATLK